MSRMKLESILKDSGYRFLRDGKHCLWSNGQHVVAVPHHKEVNLFTAKKIIKSLSNPANQNIGKAA